MTNPRENPYVGPRAFTLADKEKLAGRDQDIINLYRMLIAERIVLLFSPSGAGKTSLVQAGLLPRMQEKGFNNLPVIRVNQEIPCELKKIAGLNRYVLSVMDSLDDEDENPSAKEQTFDEQTASLRLKDYFARRLPTTVTDDESDDTYRDGPKTFLIFDQFEEILTIEPNDHQGKWEFFSQLGEALERRDCWALFVVREDFVAALDPYLRLIPTRLANTYRLDLLDFETAQEAIRKPAGLMGVQYNDTAVEKLVNDLRSVRVQKPDGSWEQDPQPGCYVEPVQLQVVCYRLWDRIGASNIIAVKDIESQGSVDEALAGFFDDQMLETAQAVGVPEKEIRAWFDTELITTNGIRTQVMWAESQSSGLENKAILYLERTHLIRGEARRGVKWYELAHDRLVDPVRKSNLKWFAKNLGTLQRQAMLWEAQGRSDHLLLRDPALAEAEKWAEGQSLTGAEPEFLKACQDLRNSLQAEAAKKEAETQRQRAEELGRLNQALEISQQATEDSNRQLTRSFRDLRIRNIVALGLLIIAVILGSLAWKSRDAAFVAQKTAEAASVQEAKQKETAEAASTLALEQKATAEAASAQANEQRATAVAASAEAAKQKNHADEEANKSLAAKLATFSLTLDDSNPVRAALLALQSLNTTEEQKLPSLALSNEALRAALSQGQGLLLTGFKNPIVDLAFSPDEKWLAACDGDEVRVWNLADPDPVGSMQTLPYPGPNFSSYLSVAFSTDGKYLATGTYAGEIMLWKLPLALRPEPQKILALSNPSEAPINLLAFSPVSDHWLASAAWDGATVLWDLHTLEDQNVTSYVLSSSGQQSLNVLQFSKNGRWLATGGEDQIVRFWDTTHPELGPAKKGNEDGQGLNGSVTALAFTADSKHIAASSAQDQTVYIWNTEISANPPITLEKSTSGINQLVYSPDPSIDVKLVLGYTDGSIKLATGKNNFYSSDQTKLGEQGGLISTLAFSADGKWLASGSDDRTILVWDWENPNRVPWRLQGFSDAISTMRFSPQSHWLAVGSWDNNLRLWNLEKDLDPVEPTMVKATFSKDREWAVFPAGVQDGTREIVSFDIQAKEAVLWDLTGAKLTLVRKLPLKSKLSSEVMCTAYNGKLLALALDSGEIAVTDINGTGADLKSIVGVGKKACVGFSANGQWLLTAKQDIPHIKAWDVAKVDFPLIDYQPGWQESLKNVHFDSHWLVAFISITNDDHTSPRVLLWDLNAPKPQKQEFEVGEGGAYSVAISPDDHWLVVGTASNQDSEGKTTNGKLRLWDLQTAGSQPKELGQHTGYVNAVAFSPDGRWLASGDDYGSLRLWSIPVSQPDPVYSFAPHQGWVNGLRFSSDGHWLGSVGQDGTVALSDMWDLPLPAGHQPLVLRGHAGAVQRLSFSSDQRWLATSSLDGTVRLWDLNNPKDVNSVALKGSRGAYLYSPVFSSGGQYLMAYSTNGALEIFRMDLEAIRKLACAYAGRNLAEREWQAYLGPSSPWVQTCPDFPLVQP